MVARLRAPNAAAPVTESITRPDLAEREAYLAMHLAMRIGELLLSGGAGAGDVTATIRAVTRAAGLERCEADVTYTVISVSYLRSADSAPITGSRFVRRYGFDGTRLSRLHVVVDALTRGEIDVATAQERVDELRRAPHPYPRWVTTTAWGGLAAAVAVLLGGGLLVLTTAFVATVVIDRVNRRLNAREVPFFYQYAFGGFVATAAAVAVAALGLQVSSSLIIASGIVVMLPGGLFVGSVQDAIGGFLVTAAARALEVVVLTTGLLTGIALALDLGRRVGVRISADDLDGAAVGLPLRILAAAAAAGLYAVANYAPPRVILSATAIGGAGFALHYGLEAGGVSATTATAGAAIAMGVVCHAVAGRVRFAPLLLVVPAIVPQLPGLLLFRGLQAVTGGQTAGGFNLLLTSVSVGFALAAGILFGQLVAQPVLREQSRLERRRGPRLIGPLRRTSS